MLRAVQASSLFDSRIRLIVDGLKAKQPVTLLNEILSAKDRYASCAQYVCSDSGQLDLATAASVGGSFQGVEQMGLFWSIEPLPDQKPGLRFVPSPSCADVRYKLSLLSGHHSQPWASSEAISSSVISSVELTRHLLHPSVRRIEIRDGRIRGALFVPNSADPALKLPAILDLYGTRGGLVEYRAALLASNGFLVLALAYFGYEDLPLDYSNLQLEYFQEAINWLSNHPLAIPGKVGVIGASLGAEIALATAQHFEQVKAVVSINANSCFGVGCSMTYNDAPVAGIAEVSFDDMEFIGGKLKLVSALSKAKPSPDQEFKIENSDAQFLLVCGMEDECNPSVGAASRLAERLRNAGKNNFVQKTYLGCGHLIEPPYFPISLECFHAGVGLIMLWGGNRRDTASAQEDAWRSSIAHFSKYVGQPVQLTDATGSSKL